MLKAKMAILLGAWLIAAQIAVSQPLGPMGRFDGTYSGLSEGLGKQCAGNPSIQLTIKDDMLSAPTRGAAGVRTVTKVPVMPDGRFSGDLEGQTFQGQIVNGNLTATRQGRSDRRTSCVVRYSLQKTP